MKILNKLTLKHLKMNKRRTIVSIIGILLSTALIVGIGLMFSTFRDTSIRENIMYSGDHYASIKNLSEKDINTIKLNKQVNSIKLAKLDGYLFSETVEEIGYGYVDEDGNVINQTFNRRESIAVIAGDDNLLSSFVVDEGRLPLTDNEIVVSKWFDRINDTSYEIGDTIKLPFNKEYISETEPLPEDYKEYKIVGVIRDVIYSGFSEGYYTAFTKLKDTNTEEMIAFLGYKNVKKTIETTELIAKNLGKENLDDIDYNSSLLALYGVTNYDNVNNAITMVMVIMIGIVAIGCTVVIYNSFAISVMERKKQFGLFSSIGTTKSQLRKTVLFEAIFVGSIGLILGVISAFIGIGVLIEVLNHLMQGALGDFDLRLAVYPLYMIISLIGMVLVIFFSAYAPTRRASKISPIEAIRQNDDIKIKGKKVKTSKLINKIFGIEGDIALKNIKRNKKKYRITVVSLFISIVLFLVFSAFTAYGLDNAIDYAGDISYDLTYSASGSGENTKTEIDKITEAIKNDKNVEKYVITLGGTYGTINNVGDFTKTEKFDKNIVLPEGREQFINFHILSDETYEQVRKEFNIKDKKPIFLNYFKTMSYADNSRKLITDERYSKLPKEIIVDLGIDSGLKANLKDYEVITDMPFGLEEFVYSEADSILLTKEMAYNMEGVKEDLERHGDYLSVNANIKSKNHKDSEEVLENIEISNQYHTNVSNLAEEMKTIKDMVLAVKILLYGFITLVTLIGVTSVFNTINTSVALRKKEFAILRSVGLSPRGFNKMIYMESFFFGIKSLLYAIPVSIIIMYMLFRAMTGLVEFKFYIPLNSIIIAVVAVFLITLITMWYATSKIKKDNIMEAIREENI